ncbi:4a-hydroxytetrahydrobiopterin dehydratase [Pleionea mediterranea]|uniref:Putative pterin-4-alpha-carbinolamine dehydratase n=1 Tax=Pleionea mediterranea TaxID=523701 RepID=A0A316FV04_9GAMM|nr:4a-hydroxytetrahydrobiopterin dehydratase [Pleionea mediterranea]PWK51895.1 pterin-4-alpha-carbinolamine dehydratase [Pleionea mediterranea]
MTDLTSLQCKYDEQGKAPLEMDKIKQLSADLPEWQVNQDGTQIQREFLFKNYYHTMNFVNAIAWIANKEAHHPDMEVNYGRCLVSFTTHDSGNRLTINDFICAAKVQALLDVGSFGPKLQEKE